MYSASIDKMVAARGLVLGQMHVALTFSDIVVDAECEIGMANKNFNAVRASLNLS